ncbi:MAG: cadmium-translocating P-type ATPase [Helicobacter sp.]|nr:cadmium-translocating P-type ATPase [Helicobacter sp.]
MVKTAKLHIDGMHCSACSVSIQNNLEKNSSILNVKINAISGKAKISYEESQISEQRIIELITSYGFPASKDNSKEREIAYIQGLKTRLLVAIPCFFVIFVLHMGGFHSFWSSIMQFLLASIAQIYCAMPFYKGSMSFFKTKVADMNVLIALGSSVTYLYSVYLFFSGAKGFYFEGSASVICFVLLGEYLKSKAKKSASEELEVLAKILPPKARLFKEDKKEWVAINTIKKGDKCLVVSGEKIPLDGKIIEGEAEVSSAHINGEELPNVLRGGDEVIAGSVVINGEIIVESLKDSSDFFVYEMLDLLELSQTQKPPIGLLADKIASVFVPCIVLFALVAFFFWLQEGFAFALSIAASILVVSCPCALGLAVPLAIVCASMRAKRNEILIKSSDVYEKAKEIKFIVFDKTGTLTKGEIIVENADIFGDKKQILSLARAMQEDNPHPIGKAILEYAKESPPLVLERKEYFIARGIEAVFNEEEYYLGSLAWIQEILGKKNLATKEEGVVALCSKKELLAVFYLKDTLRQDAKVVMDSLKNLGIVPIILSGDNLASVEKVARELGIKEYFAQTTPLQKSQKIIELRKLGGVCFVGDGINDALALQESSFGISFVGATELAKEVGDVLLLKEDLKGIVEVFQISFATLKNIKENLFFAYVYNLVLIPIAAGVLYPFVGIVLQPSFAGAAMAFSSVSVVLNALRISRLKL